MFYNTHIIVISKISARLFPLKKLLSLQSSKTGAIKFLAKTSLESIITTQFFQVFIFIFYLLINITPFVMSLFFFYFHIFSSKTFYILSLNCFLNLFCLPLKYSSNIKVLYNTKKQYIYQIFFCS